MSDLPFVVFCGSRAWTEAAPIQAALSDVRDRLRNPIIMHGGAKGADYLAGSLAEALGLPVLIAPAHWSKWGRSAGHVRNAFMLSLVPIEVWAFWDGSSPGTGSMIAAAEKNGIPVEVVRAGVAA